MEKSEKVLGVFEEWESLFNNSNEAHPLTGKQKCFYANEIGKLAIQEKNEKALDFLLKHIKYEDVSVRYAIIGYLGDVDIRHPKIADIRTALMDAITEEQDGYVRMRELAKKSLAKLTATLL